MGIGAIVRIISDNNNYDDYRDMDLVVTYSSNNGMGYDNSMYPEMLMDLETTDGEPLPFSLYEYEVEEILNHQQQEEAYKESQADSFINIQKDQEN